MLSLEQALENRVHEAGLTQVLETSTKHLGVPATQRDCSCCTSTTAEIGVNFPRLAVTYWYTKVLAVILPYVAL